MSKIIKVILSWLLPYALYNHFRLKRLNDKDLDKYKIPNSSLKQNQKLKNCHLNSTCFIVGNGPSTLKQDLTLLKGQSVFTVSNGYLHSAFGAMRPIYHCTPQISYEKMTEGDVLAWLREMDSHIESAELIFNETEKPLINKYGLFPDKNVHYLALRNSFDDIKDTEIIDITKPIPAVESVPVMVLVAAMYMGFTKIVLLGIDHDHFKTGIYKYAFKPKVQDGKDFSVTSTGEIVTNRHDDFQSLARLWRQYRCLRKIAMANQIQIINATAGGELDEFPRASLDSILAGG